jgi:hypothetical protein
MEFLLDSKCEYKLPIVVLNESPKTLVTRNYPRHLYIELSIKYIKLCDKSKCNLLWQ